MVNTMVPSPPRAAIPGDLLLSWPSVLSLIVLILNDRVLKEHVGGSITGKLSDVAGLVFAPLLLLSFAEFAQWTVCRGNWRLPRGEVIIFVAAVAAAFAAVKLFGPCTEAYIWLMRTIETPAIGLDRLVTGNSTWFPPIHVVRDPSDLIALPAVLVPLRIGWSRSVRCKGLSPSE